MVSSVLPAVVKRVLIKIILAQIKKENEMKKKKERKEINLKCCYLVSLRFGSRLVMYTTY